MTEAEQVMKRCQIGTRNYNEANNLHADCYRVIGKLLAEHAMREVQRLGQEIEQAPVIGKWSLREVYFDEDGEPISHRSPPQRKPLLASEIVTMYAERPTSDNDMIEFARAIEAEHGITGEHNGNV